MEDSKDYLLISDTVLPTKKYAVKVSIKRNIFQSSC